MKRLVLCCDGTWNGADQERDGAPCPTNVVKPSPEARALIDPTQSLHGTVRERWDGDATYQPGNVREYLKRTGDPRGTAP